ncbi:hypothetical protein [Pseudonocardia sp. KRD291]|uniref:hypothetical protein n=1 Tax=Pseudonocardia sp. KRD291 TaxID=2792007 RepID=UPI001C49E207|nr:hypothetical protein [Pseudonocardia sp. KRD291]
MGVILRGLVRGATAGAAGTTALNAVSGADAAIRGRPGSDAPQELVAALVDDAGVTIPGRKKERERRIAALGPLAGTASGVLVGAAAGALRAAGLRLPTAVGGPVLGVAAMLASDVPLALTRVSDPRSWSRSDWMSDVVPHLAYGAVTHRTLVALSAADDETGRAAPVRAGALGRAAALGLATGSRSSAGLAAVALTSGARDRGLAGLAGGRAATGVTLALAAGELYADKQPFIPDRLEPQGLVPRVVLGGGTAGAVAARDGDDPDLPTLVGALSAVAGAAAGMRLRAVSARRFGSDRPGALAEDVVAALLGWLGARRRTTPARSG